MMVIDQDFAIITAMSRPWFCVGVSYFSSKPYSCVFLVKIYETQPVLVTEKLTWHGKTSSSLMSTGDKITDNTAKEDVEPIKKK